MSKDKKVDKQYRLIKSVGLAPTDLSGLRLGQKLKQYVYIVQATLEPASCKIGKTNDLKRRLKEYNSITGKSKNNIYQYLFTCEVKNMKQVEDDIKNEFNHYREETNREMYFYNPISFKEYVEFIKAHKLFIKEIHIKPDKKEQVKIVEKIKIVNRTKPSLKERGLSHRDVMQKAKNVDNDEFFTQYKDVEKELNMYDVKIWKDKVIFCNCDDAVGPENDKNDKNTSAFALYFIQNFERLELKKLICTHYAGVVDLFNQGPKGYVFTYIFTKTRSKEFKEFPKGYTGSFDDPLSLKILNEEADIICTNPPFSRMIDYWKVIIGSGKKFLIISNISNVINTAFRYFKNNKVWAGYNSVNWFLTPKKELTSAPGHWYTNIPIKNRPGHKRLKFMPLKEIPEKSKLYDDDKMLIVKDGYIPSDYKKPFAVSNRPILNGLLEKGYKIIQDKRYDPYIKGEGSYSKIVVQKI